LRSGIAEGRPARFTLRSTAENWEIDTPQREVNRDGPVMRPTTILFPGDSQAVWSRSFSDSRLVPVLPHLALTLRRLLMPQESGPGSSTRRTFTRNALQSLTGLVLIEGLWSSRLLGADVRPIIDDWFKELDTISRDVHDHRA